MPALGRALAFYFKYWDEMERLYWNDDDEEAATTDDQAALLKLVRAVGDAAEREAAEFLHQCGDRIEAKLGPDCNLTWAQRDATLQRDWKIKFWICPKRRRLRANRTWQIGLNLRKLDASPEITTWLWGKGGRIAEEHAFSVLGITESAKNSIFGPGHLILGRFQIPTPNENFDLEAEPLLRSLDAALQALTRDRIERLFADDR